MNVTGTPRKRNLICCGKWFEPKKMAPITGSILRVPTPHGLGFVITELRPIGLAKCRRCAERPVGPPGKCYGFEFVHAVGQYVEWARARIFFPGNPTEVRE